MRAKIRLNVREQHVRVASVVDHLKGVAVVDHPVRAKGKVGRAVIHIQLDAEERENRRVGNRLACGQEERMTLGRGEAVGGEAEHQRRVPLAFRRDEPRSPRQDAFPVAIRLDAQRDSRADAVVEREAAAGCIVINIDEPIAGRPLRSQLTVGEKPGLSRASRAGWGEGALWLCFRRRAADRPHLVGGILDVEFRFGLELGIASCAAEVVADSGVICEACGCGVAGYLALHHGAIQCLPIRCRGIDLRSE